MLDGVDDDASACMLDELAAAFKKTFPSRSGLTAPARAVLVSLAQSFTLGIAEIEARHAATRRITSVVGCQTHVPSLISVSASWVCRRNAAERQSVDLFRHPNADQLDATEDAVVDDEPAAVDGRSAGPWKAFLSFRKANMPGRLGDCMPALRLEYAGLSEAERQHWIRMGNLGRLSAERGFAAFKSPRPRNLALPAPPVHLPDENSDAEGSQLVPLEVDDALRVAVPGVEEIATIVQAKLQEFRAYGYERRKARKQEEMSCLEMVEKFRNQVVPDALDDLFCRLLPQLEHLNLPLDAWRRHPNLLPSLQLVRLHLPADFFTEAGPILSHLI